MDDLLQELLERVRNRFYGKYRGSVTEVDDQTLRLKARVPAVLGDQVSGWCSPCLPYAGAKVGMAFLPEPGAGVWIEFEGGDVSYPIWVGCYWREGEVPSQIKPKVRGIVTEAGHSLLFDDEAKKITLSDANNNEVTLSDSGITLKRGGQKIVISDSTISINDGALEVT
jgi:uncharacterized protein involved in type VI secretion and phage assembly